jgi:hypothetical protein
VDASIAAHNFGVVRLLLSAAEQLAAGRKKEVRSLKALGDRKMAEIEATHKLFIQELHKLKAATDEGAERLIKSKSKRTALKQLKLKIQKIEKSRETKANERMMKYVEARVYSKNTIQEKGALKRIPDDIASQLQHFMRSYCVYFEADNVYNHSLRRAVRYSLDYVDDLLNDPDILAKEREKNIHRVDFDKSLRDLSFHIFAWIDISEQLWPRIADEYYKLSLVFREHGVV